MAKLFMYPALIFGVLLAGLTSILLQNYNEETSPNWLIYSSRDPANGNPSTSPLYLLNLDTGDQRTLTNWLATNVGGLPYEARWSPDGRWVYFKATDANGRSHLYRQHFGMDAPELVIADWEVILPSDFRDLGKPLIWTADGEWIVHSRAYETTMHDSIYDKYRPVIDYTLYQMRPNGTDARIVAESAYTEFFTLSPDSHWLYYFQYPPKYKLYKLPEYNVPDLYRVSLDGQIHQKLLSEVQRIRFLGWSKDEAWLFLRVYQENDTSEIWRLQTDGRVYEQLLPASIDMDADSYEFVRWLDEGLEMLLKTQDAYYSLNIVTLEFAFLMNSTDSVFFWISSDKQWIYIPKYREGIYRIPLGENTEPDWLIDQEIRIKEWQKDLSGFYYQIEDEGYHLYYFDGILRQSTHLAEWQLMWRPEQSYISPDKQFLLIIVRDMCRLRLEDGDYQCLTNLPNEYEEEFIEWSPGFEDKTWHPNQLFLLSSSLLVGCGGAVAYFKRKN